MKSAIVVFAMFFMSLTAVSQGVVKGRLVDAQTKKPLVGASVVVDGSMTGTASELDGSFILKISKGGEQTLVFRHIGYREQRRKIVVDNEVRLGEIGMETEYFGLGDVTVTASVAVQRKTPVAVSAITPIEIESKLSSQEFPEILKSTPGTYATKVGGGYGDARVNLRGFEAPNVAIMVNGVPMNDMEWGGVYWSNWAGLSDVTRSLQVQRGLGASKVSAPSVGGSINIVTNSTNISEGGSLSYAIGNDGYNKLSFNVSTGLKHGWAMSLLGAKTWGDGYIQGTAFEAYSYFVNISRQFNAKHLLSFTAVGAPQWHDQRSQYDKLTIAEWEKQPGKYRYNPVYGFGVNGQYKTSAKNGYHKPQLSLNHFWTIGDHSGLSTVLYVSIGRGYGYSGQGVTSAAKNDWFGANSSTGVPNTKFRAADGTFDYEAIYELNKNGVNGSQMVMSKSVNNHNWYGLISTYSTKIGQNFDVYGGIDMRYYQGIHTNKLIDLYGGSYYIDNSRASVVYKKDDLAWQNEKLKVGDIIYRDYDGYVMQEGVFGQIEYNRSAFNTFVSGSLSNTAYWRYDRFYYAKDRAMSDKLNFIGYNLKGGINYNLSERQNIFLNIGAISRAPFFSGGAFLQSTTSNATNKNAINEKVFSAEFGYGFRSSMFTADLNVYRTLWSDKTMTTSLTLGSERGTINMSGLDALHQGIELDIVLRSFECLDITGMLSIGDWKWASNATGYAYNLNGQPIDKNGKEVSTVAGPDHAKVQVNLKDVRVGNSAQWTGALGVKYKMMEDFCLSADYTYYDHNYANYSLTLGSSDKTYQTPWRIPAAGVADANVSYRFMFGKLGAVLSGNINNLLNEEYITDADVTAGVAQDWKTARVFYGFGRTFSIRLKLEF